MYVLLCAIEQQLILKNNVKGDGEKLHPCFFVKDLRKADL